MQFLKKHYEKIILCAVLIGLAVAAISMGEMIADAKRDLVNVESGSRSGKSKPLPRIDLTADQLALAQITNPPPVELSGQHNLFNPVTWRRKPDGELLKILTNGPDALVLTAPPTPLYTEISYSGPSGTGGYAFSIQQHSGRKISDYIRAVGDKGKFGLYIVHGIKGATDNPSELELDIPATGETVGVSQGKPYKRVDSYIADLKYEPQSQTFLKRHVDDVLNLDDEQYKIIEITNDLVRVQSVKNTRNWTIKWNGSP